MRNASKLLLTSLTILFIFTVFGCAKTKSYVNTGNRATYEDIMRRTDPYKVKIIAEFQRNGEHLPKVDAEVQGHVERVVRGSGFIIPASEDTAGELKVIINNVADVGKAAAKGLGTGMTFGLAGSAVIDHYEMEANLSLDGKAFAKNDYKHEIYTTVGVRKAPEGLEQMTLSAAFAKVVEQLLLDFLRDVQNSGQWSMNDLKEPGFLKSGNFVTASAAYCKQWFWENPETTFYLNYLD
jgi:hypothetical protein